MLLRYFHTLKYLRPIQIIGQIRHRLYRPKPDLRPTPQRRPIAGSWRPHHWRQPAMTGPQSFRFLNEEKTVVFPQAWNAGELDKLWLYNLHYFDDLNAEGAEARNEWHEALIRRWIVENPPARGNGWEPYPLSLRIVNWIKWELAGNTLNPDAVASLAIQVRRLRRSLEVHLLGNHLFENAKALVFAGLFFAGQEAEEWFQTGIRLLDQQIREQILLDGGHFELSPMYHALILEGLMDLANICLSFNLNPPDEWRNAITAMFNWLGTMCHPDGDIAFFNDAAVGVAPRLEQLERYADSLGLAHDPSARGSVLLAATGYARLERADAVLLADVAKIGPDYLPGHAHADSLSFELSLHGRRILVNSGTSRYGVGPERLRQRGTAAHNTVQIDGSDSSEVWSGFRVARRARVAIHRFDTQSLQLEASHDGYTRLPGRPVHKRCWMLDAGRVEIEDIILGEGDHLVETFFHFHPDVQIEAIAANAFSVRRGDTPVMTVNADENMRWEVERSSWHPEFGISRPNLRLRGRWQGALPARFETRMSWRD